MRVSIVLFVACAGIILVAQGVILRFMLGRGAAPVTPSHPDASPRAAEIAWAVIPALGLMAVLWFTWTAVRRDAAVDAATPHEHEHAHAAPAAEQP